MKAFSSSRRIKLRKLAASGRGRLSGKLRDLAWLSKASADAVGQEVAVRVSFRDREVKQTKHGQMNFGLWRRGRGQLLCSVSLASYGASQTVAQTVSKVTM